MIHRTAGTLEVGFTRGPCRQLVAPWRVMLRPLRPAELVGRGFGDQCNVAPTSASHRSVAAHIRADPFGVRALLPKPRPARLASCPTCWAAPIARGAPQKFQSKSSEA